MIFFIIRLIPSGTKIQLHDGGYAVITKASFLRSFFPEASATIDYKSANGNVGNVTLWQDEFDGPITIIAANKTNTLLCLYDDDVELRIFKIDTSKPFNALKTRSNITNLLFSSTWEIENGTYDDWQEMLEYLRQTDSKIFSSESVTVGFRFGRTPAGLLKELEYQHIK